jgi:uncharacterized membrane protein YhhN
MARTRALARTAYAVLAGTDTVLAGSPRHQRLRLVTKPLLMPTLAAALVASGRDDTAVRRTLAAQALSWGGDLALLGHSRRAFLTGTASFLGAHLAYISAYRERSDVAPLSTPAARAIVLGGAVAAAGMGVAAGRNDPRLGLSVALYGTALGAMVATSTEVPDSTRLLATGTSLFMLSDTMLGVRKFLLGDRGDALEAAVMATYTSAQWCISEGVGRVPTGRP